MNRRRKILVVTLLGFFGFLALESLLPAHNQPTAQVCLTIIDGYQAVGSPALRETGVKCKYTPSCSHYAEDAIGHYGTIEGTLRTGGRLFRCSPWGGNGYDPAVEEISVQDQEPAKDQAEPATQDDPDKKPERNPDESLEDYNRRLQMWQQEKMARDLRKAGEEARKLIGQGGAEAATGCAIAGVGCVITTIFGIVVGLGGLIFYMIWVYKDAKARNDQNLVIWLILPFLVSWVVALIVYIAVRPKGDLSPCAGCQQKMMTTLEKCPHCGVESGAKPQA